MIAFDEVPDPIIAIALAPLPIMASDSLPDPMIAFAEEPDPMIALLLAPLPIIALEIRESEYVLASDEG